MLPVVVADVYFSNIIINYIYIYVLQTGLIVASAVVPLMQQLNLQHCTIQSENGFSFTFPWK